MTSEKGLAIEYAKVAKLQQIVGIWPTLSAHLLEIRSEQVEKLIVREDNETRGRIRQLDDLLQLPDTLARAQQYLSGLSK